MKRFARWLFILTHKAELQHVERNWKNHDVLSQRYQWDEMRSLAIGMRMALNDLDLLYWGEAPKGKGK